MLNRIFKNRFAVMYGFIMIYLILSMMIRLTFFFFSISEIDVSIISIFRIFVTGLFFDVGAAVFFVFVFALYLFLMPKAFIGSFFDKIFLYFILTITIIISLFSLFGEFPFWNEFSTRYNFIAVDYLIYTYEVVENIKQSYSIPALVLLITASCAFYLFILSRAHLLKITFSSINSFKHRVIHFSILLVLFYRLYRFC